MFLDQRTQAQNTVDVYVEKNTNATLVCVGDQSFEFFWRPECGIDLLWLNIRVLSPDVVEEMWVC